MIYLHKILPLLASPMSLVIFLLIWGAVWKRTAVSFAGIILFVLCSLPIISNKLISSLERGYSLSSPSDAEKADAVVVLSGMVRAIDGKEKLQYEWSEASDRIFSGIELVKEGKAPYLILTGGKLPWSVGVPEGHYLKEIAKLNGIPDKEIFVTENVENTDQEARAVAQLLKHNSPEVILVTSAFHMPRAKIVFEAAGIVVFPFPVDFLTSARKTTVMDFIPSASSFRDTSFFVREVIGRLYYTIKY
ncbi:YdcF family protein [Marimonas sp. MJW-29]|uniref:YdcF family protein n=1 Tax=Sulfitobacter sediminis TaxID=3234186 RepID=A0ABV3RT96_9RHOB